MPISMQKRGPLESMSLPSKGLSSAEVRNPKEKAPATVARSHPNSWTMGANRSEKDVRALTPTAMVTKAMATISQP